ncbi:protein of unknown function (plasmid) [Azospirillum baldaniorum]|uniref:Uncharacterized protein n=1 Tax=Azospirillum baldaniorum TaxID=1064539 RepID=A0A9P1NNA4_9PROT|nr:protein of unknown function [Azospirillum baldaniorum]
MIRASVAHDPLASNNNTLIVRY